MESDQVEVDIVEKLPEVSVVKEQRRPLKKQASLPVQLSNAQNVETGNDIGKAIASSPTPVKSIVTNRSPNNNRRNLPKSKQQTAQSNAAYQNVNYSQLKQQPSNVFNRRQSSLIQFINKGPYSTKNFKIDKVQVLKSAFAKDLDIIYDAKASSIDKIRRILLSPQFNLIIILLILLDWIIAVCALLSDLFDDDRKTQFEEFAKFFSIGLLSLFIIEVLLKIILLPGIFFRSKLELFDAFIVLTSFAFETVLILKNIEFHGVSSVLTMFRLWRIVRLINRLMIAVEANIFKELNLIRDEVIVLLKENEKLKADLQNIVVANLCIRPSSIKDIPSFKVAEV